jgi:ribokinase
MNHVLVFGSINLDLTVQVPRLPSGGETVVGSRLTPGPGGKGANQAHAARLYGAAVSLVGAVGHDGFADDALSSLAHAGVDLTAVRRMQGVTTGLASISVAPGGENQIVVAPGANDTVRATWVSEELVAACDLLLLQNEVALAHSLPVIKRFKAAGRRVILNLAPVGAIEQLEPGMIDWLVVNEHELTQLCSALSLAPAGTPAVTAATVAAAWNCTVVATLGAAGVVACKAGGDNIHVKAPEVNVVDSTGAGDTFCGTLAAAVASGASEQDALVAATCAASLSCQAHGAQASQPSRHQVNQAVARLMASAAR